MTEEGPSYREEGIRTPDYREGFRASHDSRDEEHSYREEGIRTPDYRDEGFRPSHDNTFNREEEPNYREEGIRTPDYREEGYRTSHENREAEPTYREEGIRTPDYKEEGFRSSRDSREEEPSYRDDDIRTPDYKEEGFRSSHSNRKREPSYREEGSRTPSYKGDGFRSSHDYREGMSSSPDYKQEGIRSPHSYKDDNMGGSSDYKDDEMGSSMTSSNGINSEFVHILPEHESELCHKLCQQWQEGQHCDIVISVKGGELRAHSCIMAASSPKMKVLLENSSYNTPGEGFYIRLTFEATVMRCLLNMIYTGVLSFNTAMLSSVMSTARWLQMDEVVRLCQEFKEATGNTIEEPILSDDAVLIENVQRLTSIIPQEVKQPSGNKGGTKRKSAGRGGRKKATPAKKTKVATPPKSTRQKKKADKNQDSSMELCKTKIKVEANTDDPVDQDAQVGNSSPRSGDEADSSFLFSSMDDSFSAASGSSASKSKPSKSKRKGSKSKKGSKCNTTDLLGETDKDEVDFALGKTSHITCKRCLLRFTKLDDYFRHIADHPTFPCDICDTKYYRKSNLTRHMRTNHSAVHHLQCKKCDFVAKTENILRAHFKDNHKDSKPFICEHPGCTYSAWKYDFLNKHSEIHSEIKQYVCNKCGQSFSQYAGLKSHQRACFQLQQFLCDVCGQAFNHVQSMRAHRRTIHFGEKPFLCKTCGSQFSDQRNLKRHMLIHENSFPYQCPICHQKYRHSNSLKAHMKKHGEMGSDMTLMGLSSHSRPQKRKPGMMTKQSRLAQESLTNSRFADERPDIRAMYYADSGMALGQNMDSVLLPNKHLLPAGVLDFNRRCGGPSLLDQLNSAAETSGMNLSTNSVSESQPVSDSDTPLPTYRLEEMHKNNSISQVESLMEKGFLGGSSHLPFGGSSSSKIYTSASMLPTPSALYSLTAGASSGFQGSRLSSLEAGMKTEQGEEREAYARDKRLKGQSSYGLQTLAEICFHSTN